MPDYRSQRSASPDGEGRAKGRFERAWNAYVNAVRPVSKVLEKPLRPLILPIARAETLDLLGFWLAWQTCGGFEGVQKQLGMSRSAVYRRISLFRTILGEHPDTFKFPGVTIDMDSVVAAAAQRAEEETPGD